MNNFGRVLRLAVLHKFLLTCSVVSSLCVATFWGGNISALYPLFEVILGSEEGRVGQTLQTWVDKRIAKSEQSCQELENLIAAQDSQIHRDDLAAEHRALQSAQTLRPYIVKYAPDDPFRTVLWLVGILLAATVIKGLCMFANLMFVNSLCERAIFDLRNQVYDHALRIDMKSLGERRASSLLGHVTADIPVLRGGLATLLGTGVLEPLKMVSCLVLASLICWRLLVLSLLCAPLAIFSVSKLGKSIKRASRRSLDQTVNLFGVVSETLHSVQTVQAYTMEAAELNRFKSLARECWRKSMRIVYYIAAAKPLGEILGITVVCVALIAGAYLVINQETHLLSIRMCERPLSISSLLVFYGLLIGVSDPARKLSDFFNSMQGAFASADRLYQFLDSPAEVVSPAQPRSLPPAHQRIIFEHVDFHYDSQQPVLRDFNLTIKFGETLAVVGPNGCGKSTLINLLPRFFDPVQGAVRFDDVDLREANLNELRNKIGYVTQQGQIFDDTVFNNIRYGSVEASEEQVIAAAQQAHAHQFITEKLANGYQTVVGQGGGQLSGGQRQRLALARVILRDPEILILDEATSQVDLESEQLIHKTLEKFVRGRTAIIITHRLSTLALANRILVMEAGRAIDVGTHDELLRRCDLYRRLHEIQFKQTA